MCRRSFLLNLLAFYIAIYFCKMTKMKRKEENRITIAFSSRSVDQAYIDHIESTCGNVAVDIHSFQNKGDRSLTEIYNEVLTISKNEIIVFCHDDLIFETQRWAEKFLQHFKRSPNYGILGVAGANQLVDGRWWSIKSAMHGIVNHTDGEKKWANIYSQPQGIQIKKMVALDGVLFAVNRKRLKCEFDEDFKGFHFYDIPFCVENYLNGVNIGVITDVRVTHLSGGRLNAQWEENRVLFEGKYKSKFPLKI